MDKHCRKSQLPKTVPIRPRSRCPSCSTNSSASNVEGTFIALLTRESSCHTLDFINPRFTDKEDDEDESQMVEVQTEEKPPLFLLFPDLRIDEKKRLAAATSTTQIAHVLMGKKADFSLLKPSKKLDQMQSRLSPLLESPEDEDRENALGE